MFAPKTAAEKSAYLDGWKAAETGVERHEHQDYSASEELAAFNLGWDKRKEELDEN